MRPLKGPEAPGGPGGPWRPLKAPGSGGGWVRGHWEAGWG